MDSHGEKERIAKKNCQEKEEKMDEKSIGNNCRKEREENLEWTRLRNTGRLHATFSPFGRWFCQANNRDASTGPLACPLARPLAPLTHSLRSSWESVIFDVPYSGCSEPWCYGPEQGYVIICRYSIEDNFWKVGYRMSRRERIVFKSAWMMSYSLLGF